ncbi:putative phosphatidylinositol N-acetylglucosaminyltransferase subunit Y [Helianthus annuus]|nr:putative phosphatidylinositol N-acetylglucosaminyltransferase subunit Y [Helianthus annuus]KAJ0927932.1 putative phosphatidylinositol N-acetylglucosaminyltransferase subunit Y [Helianthus annuus]
MPTISQFITANERVYWGGFFIIFGSTFFSAFLYTAVISKLLPPSDNAIVFAIQNDRYYCFLVPLTLPVLVVAVYFYWLSMKMFKHA